MDGSSGGEPFGVVVYANASRDVSPMDPLFQKMAGGCCGAFAGSAKLLGYGVTAGLRAMSQAFYQDLAIRNHLQEEVERAVVEVLDETEDPRDGWIAVRASLDMLIVGDVQSIYVGIRDDNSLMLNLGIIGLASTAFPPADLYVTSAKTSLRAAMAAGASEEMATYLAKQLAKWGDEGAQLQFRQYTALINFAAKQGPDAIKGLDILRQLEDPSVTVARNLNDNRVLVEFLGGQAAKRGDGAAVNLALRFIDSQVGLTVAAKVWTKFEKVEPGYVGIIDDLDLLRNTDGISSVAASAAHMAPAQGKGYAYAIQRAAQHVDDSGVHSVHLGREYIVGAKALRPDEEYFLGTVRHFREFKNYEGVVSANEFNRFQMEKYAELLSASPSSTVEYYLKNGQATTGFLEKARAQHLLRTGHRQDF